MNHLQKLKAIKDHIDSREDAVELQASHFRGDGVYVRTLGIEAGFGFIGKTHKKDHVFVVVQGRIAITDEHGDRRIYNAPYVLESKAGAQRTLVALDDTILLNAHGVDNDIEFEDIEDFLTEDPLLGLTQDKREAIG